MSQSGRLILVVGPSGSGKDTLLDAARERFAGTAGLSFARRDITRPETAGGENHRAVSVVEFEENLRAGNYPLHWDAHQLRYGVPMTELMPLERGEVVILNGSRSVVDEVLAYNPNAHIVSIRVGEDILQGRLRQRAREDERSVQARLKRADAFDVTGPYVTEVWNEGSVEEGCARFNEALEAALKGYV